MKTELEKIQKLPFVERVEYQENTLIVDVGEIFIKGNYIGKFTIMLSPSKLDFENYEAKKYGLIQHPHDKCFGGFRKDIKRAYNSYQWEEAVILFYKFLGTYDKGNCKHKLSVFKGREKLWRRN